jgi:O-antigen/teichoic acid export membrane protein
MKPLARTLGLLPPGTLLVGAGLGVLGAASYVHLAIAGHTLSTVGMASMSVLWSLVFWLGLGLFFPVEQEVIRLVATRMAIGQGITPVVRRGALLASGVLVVALVPLAIAARPLADILFAGNVGMVAALAGAFTAQAAVSVIRGVLAGTGQFRAYGTQLAADGMLRVALAALLGAEGVRSPVLFGLILTAAPLGSVVMTLRPVWRELRPGPAISWIQMCQGLGLLIGSTLLAQLVVNVAVIDLRLLSPGNSAAVGALLSAMILTRVPLFIFASLQASLLPGLAGAVSTGEYGQFQRLIIRASAIVIGLGLAVGLPAVILGPRLIEVLFNAHPVLDPADFAWLASGTVLYMLAMVLGQGALALSRHRGLLLAWVAATAVLAIVTFLPGTVTLRVEAAYALSSLTACLGLMLVLWRSSTGIGDTAAHRRPAGPAVVRAGGSG